MNIKISRSQANFLLNRKLREFTIGSHLYGTATCQSDVDTLVIYESFHRNSDLFYPNYHQFQFDDLEKNEQFIFTSEEQFYKNLSSGDSTINADVILFIEEYSEDQKLNICRTYNITKAFLGFAKRDLNQIDKGRTKNKLFHARRGLYCADALIHNQLPELEKIKNLSMDKVELQRLEVELRKELNGLYESGDIQMYYKDPVIIPNHKEIEAVELELMLMQANNTREFKY